MTDNVVTLDMVTRLDIPPERVLGGALEHGLDQVVVVGFDKDGETYFASSVADGGAVLWLFELAKRDLLKIAADMSDGAA